MSKTERVDRGSSLKRDGPFSCTTSHKDELVRVQRLTCGWGPNATPPDPSSCRVIVQAKLPSALQHHPHQVRWRPGLWGLAGWLDWTMCSNSTPNKFGNDVSSFLFSIAIVQAR